MREMAVILVYSEDGARMLTHARTGDPYRGLYDLVGGRCGGESALACAYRVLREETGIEREEIDLRHAMDFAYHTTQWCVQVFAGQLRGPLAVEPPLCWVPLEGTDFFDAGVYAGDGYIGHILSHMRMQMFAPEG